MGESKAREEKGLSSTCNEGKERLSELSELEQERVRLIAELSTLDGSANYRKRQDAVAKRLGITVRSVQRWQRRYREEGISGLLESARSDRGQVKIGADWEKFIIKTYKEGNRGSCKLSPAQVAVRVKVRAQELGEASYPSRATVYRLLEPFREEKKRVRGSLGWRGDRLSLQTREGLEIEIEWANQVWQADHTKVDVLLVDSEGELIGRPWLTIVVDTYSRCIMGMHIGFDAPSAQVVCLALRHAILPKRYPVSYDLQRDWGTYGLPQYLYTDGGKDFRSKHLEQVTLTLGIVPCLRRRPSDGGIVERPFGTFNTELLSGLPGYVSSNVSDRSLKAELEACLTLQQFERLLVRYIVDNYNQSIDARMADQSRIGRWEAGRAAQLQLLGERELDICLMKRDRRRVYRSGYIQFASLTYLGEHLAAYAGESVIIRYNPRDITTIWVYEQRDGQEVFLARAHAQGWETEILSYKEAQVLSQRRRELGKAISTRSMLSEVRDRDERIKQLRKQKQPEPEISQPEPERLTEPQTQSEVPVEPEIEPQKQPVPYVKVYDYEELKRRAGLW